MCQTLEKVSLCETMVERHGNSKNNFLIFVFSFKVWRDLLNSVTFFINLTEFVLLTIPHCVMISSVPPDLTVCFCHKLELFKQSLQLQLHLNHTQLYAYTSKTFLLHLSIKRRRALKNLPNWKIRKNLTDDLECINLNFFQPTWSLSSSI